MLSKSVYRFSIFTIPIQFQYFKIEGLWKAEHKRYLRFKQIDTDDFTQSNNTESPTIVPTISPSLSSDPTSYPTLFPTIKSYAPSISDLPSSFPTTIPSIRSTIYLASNFPTTVPTSLIEPTIHLISPSSSPTLSPLTSSPTNFPTYSAMYPSSHPTVYLYPTIKPTVTPTSLSTSVPTLFPTSHPTGKPTPRSTTFPTTLPSIPPTSFPTVHPTSSPTSTPTSNPTSNPISNPNSNPTSNPTIHPSSHPTSYPNSFPTSFPSSFPTPNPTFHPTSYPTQHPTSFPTTIPSVAPSMLPTPQGVLGESWWYQLSAQFTVHLSAPPTISSSSSEIKPTNGAQQFPTQPPSTQQYPYTHKQVQQSMEKAMSFLFTDQLTPEQIALLIIYVQPVETMKSNTRKRETFLRSLSSNINNDNMKDMGIVYYYYHNQDTDDFYLYPTSPSTDDRHGQGDDNNNNDNTHGDDDYSSSTTKDNDQDDISYHGDFNDDLFEPLPGLSIPYQLQIWCTSYILCHHHSLMILQRIEKHPYIFLEAIHARGITLMDDIHIHQFSVSVTEELPPDMGIFDDDQSLTPLSPIRIFYIIFGTIVIFGFLYGCMRTVCYCSKHTRNRWRLIQNRFLPSSLFSGNGRRVNRPCCGLEIMNHPYCLACEDYCCDGYIGTCYYSYCGNCCPSFSSFSSSSSSSGTYRHHINYEFLHPPSSSSALVGGTTASSTSMFNGLDGTSHHNQEMDDVMHNDTIHSFDENRSAHSSSSSHSYNSNNPLYHQHQQQRPRRIRSRTRRGSNVTAYDNLNVHYEDDDILRKQYLPDEERLSIVNQGTPNKMLFPHSSLGQTSPVYLSVSNLQQHQSTHHRASSPNNISPYNYNNHNPETEFGIAMRSYPSSAEKSTPVNPLHIEPTPATTAEEARSAYSS
jgi:hypothetical protein